MSDVPKIAGVPITTVAEANKRISLLLWGVAGCGKTSLATTMPGKKLWLKFDPDGTASIKHVPNIIEADFTASPASIVESFKTENPGRIEDVLKADEEIESIVFDSVTSFGDMALEHGVPHASRTAIHKGASLEDPGYGGYGRKLAWVMAAIKQVSRSAAKYGCHVCFIAHESTPTKDKQGNYLFTTIHLSNTALSEIPNKLSEIWYMSDTGTQYKIAVRSVRGFKPMKTRMFAVSPNASPEFVWKYDMATLKGEGISDWFDEWKNAPGKIDLPG